MEGINHHNQVKWESINFVFYLSFAKWPILAAFVVELLFRLLVDRFWYGLSGTTADILMWLIRLAAFIYLGRMIFKKYGEVPPIGAFAGLMAGAAVGFLAALIRFIFGFKVWKLFNVATETALTAIIGCLAVFLVVYVWDSLPNLKKK